MRDTVYDFAAIGIGPFNLGLACLTAPIEELNGLFLDKSPDFNWHPGMMLTDVRLQTPFLSDLVTLADPTSPFSFLNYIKEQGRMYSFYIRENFFLLRQEYNQYCQWAARQLDNLHFNTEVLSIEYSDTDRCYVIHTRTTGNGNDSGQSLTYRARRLVLGTGPVPFIPPCSQGLAPQAIHSSTYLDHKAELQARRSITVLGSGQSAAEIFHDLLQDIDSHGYELSWITRSPRYFPLEYTKLTLEMTSPEYVDYFYDLPAHKRSELNQQQRNLYKGINSDLIDDIYELLYTKRLSGEVKVNLLTNSELKQSSRLGHKPGLKLEFFQHEQQRPFQHVTEGLVLATGYHYQPPAFLEGITDRIRWDDNGRFDVGRYYSIDHNDREIFVQNAELHTHGFVTPDLGMACYRNSCIVRELLGREYYPVEKRIAFQQFAAPSVTEKQLATEPVFEE